MCPQPSCAVVSIVRTWLESLRHGSVNIGVFDPVVDVFALPLLRPTLLGVEPMACAVTAATRARKHTAHACRRMVVPSDVQEWGFVGDEKMSTCAALA